MSAKRRSSKVKHQPLVKELGELLLRPLDDAAAAVQMKASADDVINIMEITTFGTGRQAQGKEAGKLSSCVAVVLQAAGWLVAARKTNPAAADGAWRTIIRCMMSANHALQRLLALAPSLLLAVLQPPLGGHVPGLPDWLPVVAAVLLNKPSRAAEEGAASDSAASGATAAAAAVAARDAAGVAAALEELAEQLGGSSRIAVRRLTLQGAVMNVWTALFDVWQGNRGHTLHCGHLVWLHPAVLRLADKVLQRPLPGNAPVYAWHLFVMLTTAAVGYDMDPTAQPLLAAAAGWQPCAAHVVHVATMLQQGLWWRMLATTCTARVSAGLSGPMPWHPSQHCPPSFWDGGYSGVSFLECDSLRSGWYARQQLHVLLVAQLWDVWPWQLMQVRLARRLRRTAAAAGKAATSSSRSAPDIGQDGAAENCSSDGSDNCDNCSSSSSSSGNSDSIGRGGGSGCSSGSSREMGPTLAMPGEPLAASKQMTAGSDPRSWRYGPAASIPWPLLPRQASRSSAAASQGPLNPVTLQQLQLAVAALACEPYSGSASAALLLVLLLQRADASMRGSFLSGPGGSSLLASCLFAGYYNPAAQRQSMAPGPQQAEGSMPQAVALYMWTEAGTSYEGDCAARLVAAIDGRRLRGHPEWHQVGAARAVVLLLAWCFLQPVPDQQLGGGSLGEGLITTPYHYCGCREEGVAGAECVAFETLPYGGMEFAPGCAPTPLLLGTLEALLRGQGATDPISIVYVVAAFVQAAVSYLGQASAGRAPASTGSTDASSSSSSSSSTSSSDRSAQGAPPAAAASACSQDNSSQSSPSPDSASVPTGIGHSQMLDAMSSLARTVGHVLYCHMPALGPASNDSKSYGMDRTSATLLLGCSLVAEQVLHLAARQLQTPSSSSEPALVLAAAAQQLAVACAAYAQQNIGRLAHRLSPGSVPKWMELWVHHQARKRLWQVEDALGMVQRGVAALQQVQPWWQQGAGCKPHQGSLQPTAAAAAAAAAAAFRSPGAGSNVPDDAPCDAMSASSSARVGIDSSSIRISSSAGAEKAQKVAAVAAEIQRTCRTRLPLVGCSHPRCTNLSGPSAEGLVAGRKGVACRGCRMACYCSPACQQADWPQHRHVCRRLAAAAAGLMQATGAG